ncbi:LysR family transcriptional regulator [Jannaschia sp. M317]|uniref:LysR family transcriptional regulator n=1 Tax=Jannaschia sp. M317 TaxID=2867011 RepID=UPI0021F9E11E|nr:LysR family transcriptional regulator [Jannaschia sp. M317]UWQ17956.1 LysR family transcriptional regulator [Jannaschia sp. M317]
MPVAPAPPPDLPLNALRAVEAAARLGGFAAAAVELGVSQGAVSAHVRTVEARLGAALFRRGPRGVCLTEAGARCLPALERAFDAMADAQAALRAEAAPLRLTIAALPAIAQLWLQPRLGAVGAAFPGMSVSITAMEVAPRQKRSAVDVTLFYGPQGRDWLVPVHAPGAGDGPLLADASWSGDWDAWRAAVPGAYARPMGAVHSLYALAVAEALGGGGVAMGRLSLVAGHLAEGRLVAGGPRVALNAGVEVRACHAGGLARRVATWLGEAARAGGKAA